MSKIEETLKKIAADTSRVNSPISSSIDPAPRVSLGDPNCPHCGGIGYLRQDLPIDHPDFGKLSICSCRSNEVNRNIRNRLFKLSNLDALRHLTFDTFNLSGRMGMSPVQVSSLEEAYNNARRYASDLKGWLLLMGGYGCGKTHLAAAIANEVVSLGVPTLFITVPDLLDWLRFSYDDPEVTFEDRFEDIRNTPLLVLDDFGTQNATSWAQEKLFQLLNYRYINQLPLIITTNINLDQIEGRIQSRLQDPALVTKLRITAPDYRNPKEDLGHPHLSTLSMHGQRTFENFNLRLNEGLEPMELQGLEKAFRAAQEYAKNPRGWLVFSGPYGCGKTHLAAAIGNYCLERGATVMMMVVPDLLDHLRATFSPSSNISYDHRFDEMRTAPLLILDDLGTQSSTPWAMEKLYQLFNHRYNAELATVITTANTLDEVDGRIRSRMLNEQLCRIYAIPVPAFRGAAHPGRDKKVMRRNHRSI